MNNTLLTRGHICFSSTVTQMWNHHLIVEKWQFQREKQILRFKINNTQWVKMTCRNQQTSDNLSTKQE